MPTGYTSIIYNDKENKVTAKEFFLTCSRAFGFCIEQREEDLNSLPRKVELSDYHVKAITTAEKGLKAFLKLSDKQQKKLYNEEISKDTQNSKNRTKEVLELKARYDKIKNELLTWRVPSKLQSIVDYAVKQVTESIDFDCETHFKYGKTQSKSFEVWKDAHLKHLNWEINYHTEEYEKEKKRVKEQNEFIDELYKFLKTK